MIKINNVSKYFDGHPVINDLEAANLVGICMDPDPDETGGTSIKVAVLSAIANA